ncbi:hypothetical protein J1605_015335 [Eschrichtius robustus]|uniref:Uncharacterized protein n=1 Tax=Eschrichtius robustus TaxID=9764 RepID=A0AB34GAN6_ESCRO|nr:hypothetical protein J1605_015335 [Eschrichtius robustus]
MHKLCSLSAGHSEGTLCGSPQPSLKFSSPVLSRRNSELDSPDLEF